MMPPARRQALVLFGGMAIASLLGAAAIPAPRASASHAVLDLAAAIPDQFGPWKIDPISAAFVRPPAPPTAPADNPGEYGYERLLERTYIDTFGRRVMLSIAYGPEQTSGLELHLPEVCYRYGGFNVSARQVAELQVAGETVQMTRLRADLPLRPELVTYWVVLGNERLPDANSFRLRRLAKAVQRESVEGLLVRVSSLDRDPGRAFALQAEFIDEMVNSLSAEHRRRIFGSTPAV